MLPNYEKRIKSRHKTIEDIPPIVDMEWNPISNITTTTTTPNYKKIIQEYERIIDDLQRELADRLEGGK